MKTLFILFAGFLLFIAFAFIPPKHNILGHWKIAMKKTFKTILLAAFVFTLVTNAKAQLAGTQWQAVINTPSPTKGIFDFKQDTLFLIGHTNKDRNITIITDNITFKDGGFVVETMKYKFENDTLSLQKISGHTPCDTASIGKYKVEFKGEKMFLILVEDPCHTRPHAWPSDDPWVKVK